VLCRSCCRLVVVERTICCIPLAIVVSSMACVLVTCRMIYSLMFLHRGISQHLCVWHILAGS